MACAVLGLSFVSIACSSDGAAGGSSLAGAGDLGGAGAGTAGAAGSSQPSAGAGGSAAGAGGSVAGSGGSAAGSGGSIAGLGGSAGASAGAAGVGTAGSAGAPNAVNNVPADYKGTPFTALMIPGKINAADYDRGGAGIAWCHDMGNCSGGRTTGDYPQASGIYRPAMPANAMICSGAACDDNVGVCRMNPMKPDNTITGQAMPATDTYLCYSVAGEWTKYTVTVAQAGMYSVEGVMAVPMGGGMNLSFGNGITTGDVPLAITPNKNSGTGENFHSWDDRKDLATVTFPAPGKYLMMLTQVGRFNADSFTFTKL